MTNSTLKRTFAILLFFLITLGLLSVFVGCNKDDNTPQVTKNFVKAVDSEDGYATVYMQSDRDIKIMMLSDPQVDITEKYNAVGSLGTDKTYQFVREFVFASSPDLVIINGDMVMFNTFGQSNAPYYKRYADIFEELKIPWMPVFGNHDCEKGWCDPTGEVTVDNTKRSVGKPVLVDYLSSFEYCLMSSDAYCEDGYGNYFVNLKTRSGALLYTLCAFDCVYNPEYGDDTYLFVPTAAQVSWYRNTINALSDKEYGENRTSEQVVKSMIFNHVGIPEFKTAWDEAWNSGNPTSDYHYGMRFSGNYTDKYEDKPQSEQIFAVAKELKSTTAMFMCHHHDNDFSVDYQGVRLTFGQHSGYSHNYRTTHDENGTMVSAWKGIDFSLIDDYGNQRGGTQVTISTAGEFDINPVYANDLLDNYMEEYYIDYDAVAASINANENYSGEVARGTDRKWKITRA